MTKTKTKLRRRPINKKALIFVLLFAVVGAIIIYRSSAINPNLPGDVNNDNTVNLTDLSLLLSNYNQAYAPADFDSSGLVTLSDLSVLLSNYNHQYIPPTNPVPVGVGGSWTLKFSDEFNGSSLDLTKWQPNWLASTNPEISKPVNDYEVSCYDPSNISVGGGSLTINAQARQCKANNGITYNYASGIIESWKSYRYTYGYIEARILLDGTSTPTNWPAFWADGADLNWPNSGEIDVLEVLDGTSKPACWHFHYSGGAPGQCVGLSPSNIGWHTFGADWEPGVITFYYDGVQVGKVTSGVTSSPMFLIANLGISDTYGGPKTLPGKMTIDYIRAWQH